MGGEIPGKPEPVTGPGFLASPFSAQTGLSLPRVRESGLRGEVVPQLWRKQHTEGGGESSLGARGGKNTAELSRANKEEMGGGRAKAEPKPRTQGPRQFRGGRA